MKKLLMLFGLIIATSAFADIGATNGSANDAICDTGTLGSDSGAVELTPGWSANTIGLKWTVPVNAGISGGTGGATSCTYGQTIGLPSNPTKRGYTFKGWKVLSYQRIEYIEGSDTQYINTGFVANNGMILEARVKPTDGKMFIGSITTGVSLTRNLVAYQDGGYTFQKKSDVAYPTYDANEIVELYLRTVGTDFVGKINGTEYVNQTTSSLGVQSAPVYIGFSGYNNAVFGGRYYYVKIWDENNILVRDFIPIKDSNGTPCMYDLVSKQFFYNAGTGSFIAGPEI